MSSSPRRSPRAQRMLSAARRNPHQIEKKSSNSRVHINHFDSSKERACFLIRFNAPNDLFFPTLKKHIAKLLRNFAHVHCFSTSNPLKLTAVLHMKRPAFMYEAPAQDHPTLPAYFNPSRWSIQNVNQLYFNHPSLNGPTLLEFHKFIISTFEKKLFDSGIAINNIEMKRVYDVFEECEGHVEIILEKGGQYN